MLCGIPVAFAEDEEITVESNGVVSTENFTEDNVIYKAMQNNKRGTSPRRVKSSKAAALSDNEETVTADFDVVLGFDMSADMYDFDYNGEMSWLENFEALSEQVPEGTRFSVVTDEAGEFVADLNTEIESNKNLTYSGESDIITLLDNCADTFDDASEDRNKVVIAATANVADEAELADKIEELRDDGVIPFVFVLNSDIEDNKYDSENVYICESELDLRLSISDLYLSLEEFTYLSEETGGQLETNVDFLTDYRENIHAFNNNLSMGSALVSILNMYSCIPLMAEAEGGSYDIMTYTPFLNDFIESNNVEFSKKASQWEIENSNSQFNNIIKVWDNIFQCVQSSYVTTNGYKVINNLKRRFPVIQFKKHDDKISDIEIINMYTGPNEEIYYFDTYKYIMDTIACGYKLEDKVAIENNSVSISIKYPKTYNIVVNDETNNNTVKKEYLTGSTGDVKISKDENDNLIQITEADDRKFVVGSLAHFSGGLPNIINANRVYHTRIYTDINSVRWSYMDILTATNKDIVQGVGNREFKPEEGLERQQFVKMLLKSIGTICEEEEGNNWASNYMREAKDKELFLNESYYTDKNEWSNPIPRDEAAFMINKIFIEQMESLNIPTNVYRYSSEEIEQQKQNKRFNDITDIDEQYVDAVYQMTLNHVIEGYTDNEFKPKNTLTREQGCKIIVSCLFNLSEDIPRINVDLEYLNEDAPEIKEVDAVNGLDIDDITFDKTNSIEYILKVTNAADKYVVEVSNDENISNLHAMILKKEGIEVKDIDQTKLRYTVRGSKEYTIRLVKTGTVTGAKIKIRKVNGSQNIEFVQSSTDENGNPNYYIFIDCPEHVTINDVIDEEHVGRTLALFEDLTPGTYTVFELHHKAVAATTSAVDADEAFEYTDQLFYDAVFYNNKNEMGDMRINKIGILCQNNGYNKYYSEVWKDFYRSSNVYQNTKIDKINSVWLSKVLKFNDGIYISDGTYYENSPASSMQCMNLIMEFTVLSGTINFATVAKQNSSDFSNFDKDNAITTYEDHKEQVLKGKGDFGRIIEAKPIEYYIDDDMPLIHDKDVDTMFDKFKSNNYSMLGFNMATPVAGHVINKNQFALNASALYADCKDTFPESAILKLVYDGNYMKKGKEERKTFEFDTFHSPFVKNFNVPSILAIGPYNGGHTWVTNEELDGTWIKLLKDIEYSPFVQCANQDFKTFATFLDATNMQGYGITYKYNITIHNLGKNPKIIYYIHKIAPSYMLEYAIDNGFDRVESELEELNQDGYNEKRLTDINGGETITISLCMTQMSGSSATNINKFLICEVNDNDE